jgi:hypothetical protein
VPALFVYQAVECKVFHTGKKGVDVPPTIEGSVIYVHGYPDLKGEIKNTVIMSQPLGEQYQDILM